MFRFKFPDSSSETNSRFSALLLGWGHLGVTPVLWVVVDAHDVDPQLVATAQLEAAHHRVAAGLPLQPHDGGHRGVHPALHARLSCGPVITAPAAVTGAARAPAPAPLQSYRLWKGGRAAAVGTAASRISWHHRDSLIPTDGNIRVTYIHVYGFFSSTCKNDTSQQIMKQQQNQHQKMKYK